MKEVLETIRAFLNAQGRSLENNIIEDSLVALQVECKLANIVGAFCDAGSILRLGGNVVISLERYEERAELSASDTRGWTPDDQLTMVLPALADEEEPERWSSLQLADALAALGPDEVEGSAAIALNKKTWRD